MTSVNVNNLEIQVNESGHVTFTRDGVTWKFREGFQPRLECEEGILNFEDALSISRDVITSGVGEGIRSHYEGFKAGNQTVPYSFDTIVWVEAASSDVFFEWVPLNEEGKPDFSAWHCIFGGLGIWWNHAILIGYCTIYRSWF